MTGKRSSKKQGRGETSRRRNAENQKNRQTIEKIKAHRGILNPPGTKRITVKDLVNEGRP